VWLGVIINHVDVGCATVVETRVEMHAKYRQGLTAGWMDVLQSSHQRNRAVELGALVISTAHRLAASAADVPMSSADIIIVS